MPELPEVETTRRGIAPYCRQQLIDEAVIREHALRWPVARCLAGTLRRQRIIDVGRRAKYLLFHCDAGTLILHLGMSGSLRLCGTSEVAQRHDHIDLKLSSGRILRFNDPRRFGSLHWTRRPLEQHRLLRALGQEPLEQTFSAEYLHAMSRGRKVAVKNFIMNSRIVVGVGNIYASESLYLAGIHPARAAERISMCRYQQLVTAIKAVLAAAIKAGGSSINDFIQPDGSGGYFQHHFRVYGKAGQPCELCQQPIARTQTGQRSTFYCKSCQR